MRKKRTAQASIYEVFAPHDIGRELQAMSDWLDEHREVLDWVARDVRRRGLKPTGRSGLSVESVLRCALLKQHRQLSYEELAFHLHDSASFQAFARLPMHWCPKKSALQRVVSAIRAQTWERINGVLMGSAREDRFEPGERVRIDSTVTDSPIHEPSDSSLLWDGVRVLVRLLEHAQELPGAPALYYVNHGRVAKKRARAIRYIRSSKKRTRLYRDLLKVTRATLGYVEAVGDCLQQAGVWGIEFEGWLGQAQYYKPLIERVISQTERRVFDGEVVPASEKVVSLFEPHTDIIVKGSREVQYGHKLNLVSGRSGMILDVVIERGNPVDSQRFVPMLERHAERYGCMPRQAAADGGYASTGNLRVAKDKGVEDVAFHKKRGLAIEDMVKSQWVYRRLRNFRAGIEAGISCLKRAYGLARCTWKGLAHFHAYVWSSVVAYNLSVFARHRLA
jgi:transposase, IS5 family